MANEIALGVAAILGYARVGTTGQYPDAQLRALAAAGVDDERTYTDKLSGVANTARPGLAALLDNAPDSDTVVVTIDRLGRNVAEVTRTIANAVSAESCCAPNAKASTPTPRPAGL